MKDRACGNYVTLRFCKRCIMGLDLWLRPPCSRPMTGQPYPAGRQVLQRIESPQEEG